MVVAANSMFAFNDAMLRLVADEVGVTVAVWGRFSFFLLFASAAILPFHWRAVVSARRKGPLLLRGVIPGLSNLTMVMALGYVPFAEVAAIIFLAPVLTLILALWLLGERVGLAPWAAVVIGCAGMLIITRPWSAAFHPAYLGALATMVGIVCHQLLTRFAATQADPRAATFFMALAAVVTTSLALPFVWQAPSLLALAGMAASGLVYFVSHSLYIAAHRWAEASTLAPYSYFQLVGAMAAGFLIFGQVPGALTLAGAGAITLAGLVIVLGESRRRPPD